MPAVNWDMGTQNNVNPSIVTDGNYVLQVDHNPSGGPHDIFDMYYNGDTTIGPNTELDFKNKVLEGELFSNGQNPFVWFRANGINVSNITGIGVSWTYFFSFPNWWLRMQFIKYNAGTPTVLYTSGNLITRVLGTWYRYRIRVWDTIFPANVVRYSLEHYTGTWNLLIQWDDTSAWLKGVQGRVGIHSRGTIAAAPQQIRWDDLDIGESS